MKRRSRVDNPPRSKSDVAVESRFKPAPRPASIEESIVDRTELDPGAHIRFEMKGRMQEIAPDEPTEPLTTNLYMTNELPAEGPIEVVVAFHAQGSISGSNKDVFTALHLADIPVIASSTSRRTRFTGEVRDRYEGDKSKWIRESFADKDFADEMEDFRRGIEVGLAELRSQLEERGMGDREIRLIFMGNSYGGTIAAELSGEYKPAHLVLLAPSLRMLDRTPEEEPIMGENRPTKEEVLQNAAQAEEITVIRGASDTLISHDDAMAYSQGKGAVIELEGIGHLLGKYHNPELGDMIESADERAARRTQVRDSVVKAIIKADEPGTGYASDSVEKTSW